MSHPRPAQVYGFMGIHIGCAVVPVWFCLTWDKASEKGAIAGAWSGCICGYVAWLACAAGLGDPLDKDGLGSLESMLAGNVASICVSWFVCFVISMASPQNYDWQSMKAIALLDDDQSGLDPDELSDARLLPALRWIKKFGWGVTFILVVLWPALSTPAGTFSKTYFACWTGQDTGDSTSLQRGRVRSNARENSMARRAFAPGDGRSSKNEPKRAEHDRDTRF